MHTRFFIYPFYIGIKPRTSITEFYYKYSTLDGEQHGLITITKN